MSTDITTYVEPAPAPVVTYQGSEMIAATARALTDAHTIASAICRTAFVPKHFQGKPDDAAAAILYGSTISMDPITALQNIFVIGGKPALYARTMVAIVMSKGHKIWTEDESDGSVTVCGQRKGSDTVERVTWTSELAKRAGYDSNSKYKSDPRSMLYARASGDVARRIAPDALLGMAHNVEELSIERTQQPTVTPGNNADRLANLTGKPDQQVVEEVDAIEDDALTDRTRKALFGLMDTMQVGDADAQRRFLTDTLGRPVESRSTLTEAEAVAAGQRLRRWEQGDMDAAWADYDPETGEVTDVEAD